MKHQKLLGLVRKAINEYDMIQDGDKIAVGVSGGKDSICLLMALKDLQKFMDKKFEIVAITVSLGLTGSNYDSIGELCESIDVPYYVEETQIGEIVFFERKEKNPCSLCSKMRKGALNNKAMALGCNKIALGHNKDDVIETFFMSLFYEGRISTFLPVTYLEKSDTCSIRPLIYVTEGQARSYVTNSGINVVKNPCLVDGETKRQETKMFIKELAKKYDNVENLVFGAIERSNLEGWGKE